MQYRWRPPAAVDAWKVRFRAPTAFSEASDAGKEGYLNESATRSPEDWALVKAQGKREG